MKNGAPASFGARLKALREAAGFTQEELATIAGLSVHAISALERGHRRRPQVETVRALSTALDLTGPTRDVFLANARTAGRVMPSDELGGIALPVPLTTLLGRDHELTTLQRWMADPAARLITLTGPGGVGKTRLGIELAHIVAKQASMRVGFVTLASIRDQRLAACAIAEALGLADVSASDLPRRARAVCEDRPTLLLLDNFEQLLDAAPVIADLLAATTALRLLVTSRAPLRVRGEREYLVEPLALDADWDPTSPANAARSPAVTLFVERVRDVRPAFRVTSDNGASVAAICRRLDALPLALELAAPWIKTLSLQELAGRLEQDVLLSAAAPRDLPERQQTMNATVAWSYQLLTPDEQRVFRRLGVLPGRYPLEAVAAVAGGQAGVVGSEDVLGFVAGLIDKSLLLRGENSTRTRPLYRMLETVRAYAALELAAAGEHDDALEGLVRYCAGEASRAATGLAGPTQAEWLDRVRDDLESYRSALTWLLDCRRPAEASAIACSVMLFWMIRGHGAEGLRWYEQILALPLPPGVEQSGALLGSAVMLYTQGEMGRVRVVLTRALQVAHDAGDTNILAQAEDLYGHAEHAVGNLDLARDRFARSIELFRASSIPWGASDALCGLAAVALANGDMGRAERLLAEAVSMLHEAGPWFQLLPLYLRAILAVRRGLPDEAIGLVRQSLTHILELQDKFAFVYTLVPLAAAAVLKGSDAWAARILGARDAVTERTGATVVDHSVKDLREQAERDARARLGPDRWARAYKAGGLASISSLLKEIESHVDRANV